MALLGPSGCGKTTTLRMLAGLIAPDARHASGSTAPTSPAMPAHQRNMGYVFQSYALFPHLSVARNVGFGLEERRRAARRGRRSGSRRRSAMVRLGGAGRSAARASCPAASSSASRWRGRW